ncbi:MAG TPA: hypothetical protein DDZ42_09045 [Candidatus Rokubacteria bacterium]|nr:MAG: hypothetical protein A2050_00260 [Candidatus Rokubacteria bacterium GWA2_73_35]HBH02049.1 hypothetical protein [Candidatus Rokubacteria bacterium]
MRTPIRATPYAVERWASRFRYLRWLDALVAWLAAWATLAAALDVGPDAQAGLAAVATGLLALVPPIRVRWRPVSAWVGLAMSVRLGPGDRAWYVVPGRAEPVLVTARRGFRLVVAGVDRGRAEGIEVRRTRVLLLPERRGARVE